MSGTAGFSYAVIRAVPRVERGEFINVGVIVYCQDRAFLAAEIFVDDERLRSIDERADVALVRRSAETIAERCTEPVGSPRENDGLAYRFGILTAPRSTIIQPSPVHGGLTDDPARTLTALFERLVARRR